MRFQNLLVSKMLIHLQGCDPADVVFTSNATSAVATVLRSFPFKEGDEILVPNLTYGNAVFQTDIFSGCEEMHRFRVQSN